MLFLLVSLFIFDIFKYYSILINTHFLFVVHIYLSLGSTNITTNNTEILITDIGDDAPGGFPSLTCHTDLIACCRNSDTGGQGGRGEWYYPDGTGVLNNIGSIVAGEHFYRLRNAPQVVRLARRFGAEPTGFYCCVIPTIGGERTFCANIGIKTFLSLYYSFSNLLQLCVDPSLL